MLSVDINRDDWDQKRFNWQDKPFYRVKYASMFGLPLTKEIREARALQFLSEKDVLPGKPIILSRESIFSGEMYIELNNSEVEHEKISGEFFTMHFEGNMRQMAAWKKTMQEQARQNGLEIGEIMPYCASNHNKHCQVVLIAQLM